jgi:hypothetical protein
MSIDIPIPLDLDQSIGRSLTERSAQDIIEARHKSVRQLRVNASEPLEEIPYQLFVRLVGLYDDIPPIPIDDLVKQDLSKKFEKLKDFIDTQLESKDGKEFAKYEMGDYVQNLHIIIVDIISIDFLEANIYAVRDEYRNHVGEQTFTKYEASTFHVKMTDLCKTVPPGTNSSAQYEYMFRYEYKSLLNENRKSRLLEKHVEDTRGFLIRALMQTYLAIIIPVAVILIIILILINLSNIYNSDWKIVSEISLLLSLAALSGTTGSYLSALLRILGVRDNNQIAQNIVAFKSSEKALRMAPRTGMLFALVLMLLFSAGLISGSLFPKLNINAHSPLNFIPLEELSKSLIWCFIAGFSERLVPDIIDRLSDKAKKAEEKPA